MNIKNLPHLILLALILTLICTVPFIFKSQILPEKENTNHFTVTGCLSNDTYFYYPYSFQDIKIESSKYGEISISPKNGNLTLIDNWFLECQYKNKKISAYIPANKNLKIQHSTNILAEPIKKFSETPRRTIIQQTIHIMEGLTEITKIKQTIVFNKDFKHTLVLTDITPIQDISYINFTRKATLNLANIKTKIFPGEKTPYKQQTLSKHKNGFYGVVAFTTVNQTYFVAYWPNTTQTKILNQKFKTIFSYSWTHKNPATTKRFITVYGIVEKGLNKNSELWYQLNLVFNPPDLQSLVNSTFSWAVVGREAEADLLSLEIIKQSLPVKNLNYDLCNPKDPGKHFILSINKKTGSYYDQLKRLHLKGKIDNLNISGEKILVVGSIYANHVTKYFSDFTNILLTALKDKPCLYTYSSTKNYYPITPEKNKGIGVITTCKDPNGTQSLIIWGYTAQDTHWISKALKMEIINLKKIPPGTISLIISIDYSKHPPQKEAFKIETLGTITKTF